MLGKHVRNKAEEGPVLTGEGWAEARGSVSEQALFTFFLQEKRHFGGERTERIWG